MNRIHFDIQDLRLAPTVQDSLASVLLKYADDFATSKTDLCHSTTVPFDIDVLLGTKPIASRPHRINPALTVLIDAIIDFYLVAGLIQNSHCPRTSYLVNFPE